MCGNNFDLVHVVLFSLPRIASYMKIRYVVLLFFRFGIVIMMLFCSNSCLDRLMEAGAYKEVCLKYQKY